MVIWSLNVEDSLMMTATYCQSYIFAYMSLRMTLLISISRKAKHDTKGKSIATTTIIFKWQFANIGESAICYFTQLKLKITKDPRCTFADSHLSFLIVSTENPHFSMQRGRTRIHNLGIDIIRKVYI